MLIGYARVSTTGQNLETQIEHLQAEGCDRIFQEKLTGFDRRCHGALKARTEISVDKLNGGRAQPDSLSIGIVQERFGVSFSDARREA